MELNLCVSLLASQSAIPENVLNELLSEIPEIFYSSSGGDIRLNLIRKEGNLYADFGGNLTSAQLHIALEATTGRQWNKQQISNIGLLIADGYSHRPDFFGLMFDSDFNPGVRFL